VETGCCVKRLIHAHEKKRERERERESSSYRFLPAYYPSSENLVAHMATTSVLELVFNHLVLPPKLPGHQDTDIEGIERNILSRLVCACDTLKNSSGQQFGETWASVCYSLRICLNMNRGRLEKASVLHEFRTLQQDSPLILHVVEQNAALLIRHHQK